MKRLGRILSILLTVLVAASAVLLIAVNLYVQSQGTQTRIQQELSQRLQTPLHVRRMSVTPWSGLKLTGITIPQAGDTMQNFLDARTFALRIRFLSLFEKRLVIKEVSLVEPRVVWPQNADGKWRLPMFGEAAKTPGRDEATDTKDEVVPSLPEVQSSPAAEQPAHVARGREPEQQEKTFVPELRRVNLTSGSFHFVDQQGRDVAMFDGVDFRSNFRNAQALRGDARIEKASLRGRFFLEQLSSPLRYDPQRLEFSKISARVGGGSISGRFEMQPQTADSPFTANVEFRDVQADEIIVNAGGARGILTGQLEGKLDATGKTADPNALSGTGEIVLRDGKVQQYSLLVALGQVLQIEELQQLQLDQAHVKYHIDPGVITVDELLLQSPNIRVTSSGTIKFNGKMRLSSDLVITEKMRSQLFKPLRDKFQPTDQPNSYALDFQISGTVDRPKSNLVDKLVGEDLKNIGSAIGNFLGRGKEQRAKDREPTEEKPHAPDASAESSGAPSPAP